MNALYQLVIAGISGGGVTQLANFTAAHFRSRGEQHVAERRVDAEIEEQRNQLSFDLLAAARLDSEAVRKELADFRIISARAAHLEEALDHLEATLMAADETTRKGAEKRARAFLARMRPSVGDIRQEAQRNESARSVAKRIAGDPEGNGS